MRSELIGRLQTHVQEHGLRGLSDDYQIVLDGEPWALHRQSGAYALEQRELDVAGCTLQLDSEALQALMDKPSSALLLIARKRLIVDNFGAAIKLAQALKQLL